MNLKTIAQSLSLIRLAFIPVSGSVRTLYRALADVNSLCGEKLYQNLGYWKDGPDSMDMAAEAMADLLARTASLSGADEALDVGFGFADQDIFWAETYRPRIIRGVNISPEQVRQARARILERGLVNRVLLEEGDAARLRFSDSSFDVLTAMESAFHFRSREDFFREAWRVLRPGGRLVMADLAATSEPLSLRDRLAGTIGRSFWQIPKENLYPADIYQKKLEDCGFVAVDVRSIWNDVYPPFVRFALARLEDRELAERMNPLFRRMLMISLKTRRRLSSEA
ncbi:MAG TPA: methyltransferase domain-containing protein, partial [Blastocatellia bacterium]|nr:methyltransferase domain-containing protein [Blastocatellia bacterium]